MIGSSLAHYALGIGVAATLLTGCISHGSRKGSPYEGADAPTRPFLKVLTFKISPGEATPATVSKVMSVMKERLRVAQIKGEVVSTRSGYLNVTLDASLPVAYSSRLLTQTGYVTFRTVPNGDLYRSASARPIRSAVVESPEYAAEHSGVISRTPTLFFELSDPSSFERFTAAHLNQSLGIYLDDGLISAPKLMSPISDSGLISGTFSARELNFFAAVMAAGPLPAQVKFVSSSRVIRG
jgi:preprotein translocase subunit SecD